MTRTTPRRSRGDIALPQVRGELWWLLPLVAAAMFYLWTATSGGNLVSPFGQKTDYYNLLVDGFEHGHLYLPVDPAPELLALQDPYDPVANERYRLLDLSLYQGRYYLYFGPVPAVVAFLPWSLLPLGGDMPGNLAAALFAVLGLVFSLLFLRFVIRRWLPDAPPWMAATAAVTVALANTVPFVLRRPAIYEQAITAGYCFAAAAAWLLVSGLYGERRSLRRVGLGSLCVGLAAGCRPNLGIVAVALVLALLILWREGSPRLRTAAIVLGPFAACVVLLGAYNVARFGNPSEFGQTYQLGGFDLSTMNAFSTAYLIPGLFFYLMSPARHEIAFPFFHISPPPDFPLTLPATYVQIEAIGGLFANVPITSLALVALAPPLSRRLGVPTTLARMLALGVGLALALVVFMSVLYWGSTERYLVDVAWMLTIAALVIWIALAMRLRGHARRIVQVAGVALIAWGAAYSVAISLTGYYDTLKNNSPGTYRALANLAGPLQTAAAIVVGKPLMLEINHAGIEARGPGERYITSATLIKSADDPGPVEVIIVSPSSRTVRVLGDVQRTARGMRVQVGDARPLTVGSGAFDVRVQLHRGLNTLRLTLLPAGRRASGVRIRNLRLR